MLVIDTETTDLDLPEDANIFNHPHMTELYVAKLDDETLEQTAEFHTLLKVPVPLQDHIVRFTGITDEMLSTQPVFPEVYDDLAEFFLGEKMVLGHNINFDMAIIIFELIRAGYEKHFPYPMIRLCTIEMSLPINKKRMKLSDLYMLATGRDHMDAHRAKGDVLATIDCYKYLLAEGY